jgi:hypothetical protein
MARNYSFAAIQTSSAINLCGVGKLLYKETNKKRAQAFTMARLLKLMRAANAGGAGAGDSEKAA